MRKLFAQALESELDLAEELNLSLQDALDDITYLNSDLAKAKTQIDQAITRDNAFPLPDTEDEDMQKAAQRTKPRGYRNESPGSKLRALVDGEYESISDFSEVEFKAYANDAIQGLHDDDIKEAFEMIRKGQSQKPTQEQVRKFLADHSNELHYLYEKDPKEWDEYDMSNWKNLVKKTGRPFLYGESTIPFFRLQEGEKFKMPSLLYPQGILVKVDEHHYLNGGRKERLDDITLKVTKAHKFTKASNPSGIPKVRRVAKKLRSFAKHEIEAQVEQWFEDPTKDMSPNVPRLNEDDRTTYWEGERRYKLIQEAKKYALHRLPGWVQKWLVEAEKLCGQGSSVGDAVNDTMPEESPSISEAAFEHFDELVPYLLRKESNLIRSELME